MDTVKFRSLNKIFAILTQIIQVFALISKKDSILLLMEQML